MFKEQTRKWERLTAAYVSHVIVLVHRFIDETLKHVCPDNCVRKELWENHLVEKLQESYGRAMRHAQFLLAVERGPRPYTLNHYFNDNLQKLQNGRVTSQLKAIGRRESHPQMGYEQLILTDSELNTLAINKANHEHTHEYIHDVLCSYYKVARKRFVDVVCQQAVDRKFLISYSNPLEHCRMVTQTRWDELRCYYCSTEAA